jgi:hypothetical protein
MILPEVVARLRTRLVRAIVEVSMAGPQSSFNVRFSSHSAAEANASTPVPILWRHWR